jgi:hypothetical protein
MPSISAREDAGQHGMTTELKCSEPASLADVQALGADHVIEAAEVAAILSGKGTGGSGNHFAPDETGVRIHGAWIRGDLNLDGIGSAAGLRLTGCRLDQPLTLRDATLRWLVLEECVLPAVWADRATVGALTIKNSLVTGQHADGALRLAGTRVTADLRLTGTRVDSPAGPAVLATGLVVNGSAFMETLDARGTSPAGAVCFTGATVGDDLVLQGARLIAGAGPAFNGEVLIVKGAAWLDQGFTATGAGPSGAVCLTGARITRQLSLRGAKLANGSGPALAADLLTVRAGLMADHGFTAIGAGELAAVRLSQASIRGYLLLDGAALTNRSGPALAANRLSVEGDLTMTGNGAAGTRFSATGAAGPCTVQLRQARITGELSLERATVVSYPVQGQSGGAGPGTGDGAVCLSGAAIGGDLVLAGATLTSAAGPALLADQVTIAGDAFRCDHSGADFRATGTGDLGAVYLAGAHVGGQLCLRAAALTSKNGPALEAGAVTVDGDVLLDLGFTATGAGPRATLGLRAAAIGGRLSLDAGTVTQGRLPEEAGPPGELQGAVHLTGATVGGDLLARGATLTAFAGPALRADHLTVNGDAFGCQRRNEGFRATGTGSDGAVVLAAAAVGGQLSLSGAVITNDSGPALVADTAVVQGGGRLDEGFTATGGGGGRAVVSLAGARVGGRLSCTGRAAGGRPGTPALDLGRAQVGGLLLSTSFGAMLNVDGLTCAEDPVLLSGNPPALVPEARQAAEWRLLLAPGPARARGTLTRLGQALHLARAAHHQAADTVPLPRLDPPLSRLVPPPAGTAAP